MSGSWCACPVAFQPEKFRRATNVHLQNWHWNWLCRRLCRRLSGCGGRTGTSPGLSCPLPPSPGSTTSCRLHRTVALVRGHPARNRMTEALMQAAAGCRRMDRGRRIEGSFKRVSIRQDTEGCSATTGGFSAIPTRAEGAGIEEGSTL